MNESAGGVCAHAQETGIVKRCFNQFAPTVPVCLRCSGIGCNTVKRFKTLQAKMFHPVYSQPYSASRLSVLDVFLIQFASLPTVL